jgi:hypothetical protein
MTRVGSGHREPWSSAPRRPPAPQPAPAAEPARQAADATRGNSPRDVEVCRYQRRAGYDATSGEGG